MADMTDFEYDYLMEILTEFDDIGKKTASKIINLREEFSEFNDVKRSEISVIKRVTPYLAIRISDKLKGIDFCKPVEILYTEKVVGDFLDGQYQNVKKLKLVDLEINALLIKALCFTTVEEVITFYLHQRITRSAVTSWGMRVEKICIIAGAKSIAQSENVDVEGKKFDVKKETEEGTYYIQVKSGPNCMNIGMVNSLNDMIEKIEEKHDNALGILGMTYGGRAQISSQIKGSLKDFDKRALIGKEFWEFLSGDEDYYYKLIALIDNLSREYKSRYELPFLKLVEEKEEELLQEWKCEYGAVGEKGLDNFIQQYTSVK